MEAPKTQKAEKGDKTSPKLTKLRKLYFLQGPSPNCICAAAASEVGCSDALLRVTTHDSASDANKNIGSLKMTWVDPSYGLFCHICPVWGE